MHLPAVFPFRARPFLVAALAGALGAGAGCRPAAPAAPAAVPKIEGETVIFGPDAPQRATLVAAPVQSQTSAPAHFTGRLVWDEDVTVRVYSPVLGRVLAVTARNGDTVAAGAVLATVDSPDVAQAVADARKAESDAALAERTLARIRDLFAHGAVAAKEADAAAGALTSARAEADRAAAKLALYGAGSAAGVEPYALRTPLAGTVVEKNLNPGQEIRPDSMMANLPQLAAAPFVITDPRRLWVVLDATELDLGALQPDQPLRLTSRAYTGRTFAGRIVEIGAGLDPSTRTLKVRGRVENPALLLKAEMYVDVEADRAEPPGAVSVSAQAVFQSGSQAFVYVESTPGRYTRRAVQTGEESNGRIVVRSGLARDDRVIVEGALLLEAVRADGGKT